MSNTISYSSLWGKHLTEESPIVLNTKDFEASLVINRAALVSGNEATLSLDIGGQLYALGTLQKGKKEHIILEIRLWDFFEESYTLSVSGKDAKVDLTGYFHPPEGYSESGLESASSGTFSSDDEIGSNVMIEEIDDDEVDKAIELSEKKALDKKAKSKKKNQPEKKGQTKPAYTFSKDTKEKKTEEKPETKAEVKPETKTEEKPESKTEKETPEKTEKTKPEDNKNKKRKANQTELGGPSKSTEGPKPKKQKPNKKGKSPQKAEVVCDLCQKAFASENSLKDHKLAKHKDAK